MKRAAAGLHGPHQPRTHAPVAGPFQTLLLASALALLLAGCGQPDDPAPEPAAEGAPAVAAPEEATPDDPPPVVAPGGTDIWLAELQLDASGALGLGTPENVTGRPDRYDNQPHFVAPELSPEGPAFLYTAGDADGRTDVYRYDAATGESAPLTRTPDESEYSPTPLPDGGFSVIRVEPDGTQRLWRFEADGTAPSLLLPEVAPVGYQGWIDDDRVALFVLGQPATLQVARRSTGQAELVFQGIGPSIQPIPGRRAVSFVEVDGEESWIREYDGDTGETRRIVETPDGGSHHAWTPDGVLLMASGARILAHVPGEPSPEGVPAEGAWRDLGEPGPEGVTWSRLAVSPDGRWIALVGERGAGS